MAEKLLDILSPLYAAGRKLAAHKSSYKADIPVICVGNAVAGGSGKTPTAIVLSALIKNLHIKHSPAFLTRGYKGSVTEATLVDPARHDFKAVGDESLLLARHAITIVSPDRPEGAKTAQDNNADLIIMDDGLQNDSLIKDISFMVIDGMAGFGNLKTLPAGPLRENLGSAFARSDAFILIGHDKRNISAILPPEKPLFQASVQPVSEKMPDKSIPVLAFSGLGQPDKFYRFLQDEGYEIKSWHPFADHHHYSHADLKNLAEIARREHLQILTTEKDYVRLAGSGFEDLVRVVPIMLTFEDETALGVFLRERLTQ